MKQSTINFLLDTVLDFFVKVIVPTVLTIGFLVWVAST